MLNTNPYVTYLRQLLELTHLSNSTKLNTYIPYQNDIGNDNNYHIVKNAAAYRWVSLLNELNNLYDTSQKMPDNSLNDYLRQNTYGHTNRTLMFLEDNLQPLITNDNPKIHHLTQTITGLVDTKHVKELTKVLTKILNHLNQSIDLIFHHGKIEVKQITPDLYMFIGLISTNPRPIIAYNNLIDYDFGDYKNTQVKLSQDQSALVNFIKIKDQFLIDGLTKDLIPTDPKQFWSTIKTFNDQNKTVALTDQQIDQLNRLLSKNLHLLLSNNINNLIKPKDNKSTPTIPKDNGDEINSLFSDSNIMFVSPRTIEIINYLAHTNDLNNNAPTTISSHPDEELQKHPEIMQYLSTFIG